MTHDLIFGKEADSLNFVHNISSVTWITASSSRADFGVTLIRPVKSFSYLELVSYDGFTHNELVLHDYRSSHSCPESMPTQLQAIIISDGIK